MDQLDAGQVHVERLGRVALFHLAAAPQLLPVTVNHALGLAARVIVYAALACETRGPARYEEKGGVAAETKPFGITPARDLERAALTGARGRGKGFIQRGEPDSRPIQRLDRQRLDLGFCHETGVEPVGVIRLRAVLPGIDPQQRHLKPRQIHIRGDRRVAAFQWRALPQQPPVSDHLKHHLLAGLAAGVVHPDRAPETPRAAQLHIKL